MCSTVEDYTVDKEYAGEYVGRLVLDTDAPDPRVMWDYWSEDEVENWRNGEVYGYMIEDRDGEHMDSCFGIYGISWAYENMREQLAYFASLQPALFEVASDA